MVSVTRVFRGQAGDFAPSIALQRLGWGAATFVRGRHVCCGVCTCRRAHADGHGNLKLNPSSIFLSYSLTGTTT